MNCSAAHTLSFLRLKERTGDDPNAPGGDECNLFLTLQRITVLCEQRQYLSEKKKKTNKKKKKKKRKKKTKTKEKLKKKKQNKQTNKN
jgi:hypothetical protein